MRHICPAQANLVWHCPAGASATTSTSSRPGPSRASSGPPPAP